LSVKELLVIALHLLVARSCVLSRQAPVELVDGKLRFKKWDFGKTLFLGNSVQEREELMAEIPVMILLEGLDSILGLIVHHHLMHGRKNVLS